MTVNKGVLVYCETSGDKFAPISSELLGAGSRLAAALGEELNAVLVGHEVSARAQEAIALGANKVYVVEDSNLKYYSTEPHLNILQIIIEKAQPGIILLGQT